MKEQPISQLVKREDWQKLRSSLVGTWKKTPEENVRKLREWLGDLGKTEYSKLRIVMNYLTGSGFRSGKIKHEEIQKLRDEISNEMKKRERNGKVTKESFLESKYQEKKFLK